MGTRADCYVATGGTLTPDSWFGSIAWDGMPHEYGVPQDVWGATDEAAFREELSGFIFEKHQRDFTHASDGWPWPWEDSRLTDYAYVFNGNKVDIYCFGHPSGAGEDDTQGDAPKADIFPDMTARANVQLSGAKSGLIVVSVKGGRMVAE